MRKLPLSIILIHIAIILAVSSCGKTERTPSLNESKDDPDSVNEQMSYTEFKGIYTFNSRVDTTINDYRLIYELVPSDDPTDLIGPFDPESFCPIHPDSMNCDSVLYYKGEVAKIVISKLKNGEVILADSVIFTRKYLANLVGEDIRTELSHYGLGNIFVPSLNKDSVCFTLSLLKQDSDFGYDFEYLWTEYGDSIYECPMIYGDED